MKPRILSWNVRGLNKRSKRLRISNLFRDWKVDIICFQETKVQGMSRSFVRSLWGCNHVDWCYLDSCGASIPCERSGEGSLSAMRDLSNFIFDQGLMDLPLAGGSYSWSLRLDPLVWSRIDRFLVSPDWEARFPMVSQKRLPHLYSDHFPILLDCVDVSRGGGKGLSNLRTCGLKRIVLWKG
jgi:exonuclease III